MILKMTLIFSLYLPFVIAKDQFDLVDFKKDKWQILKYSSLTPNRIKFKDNMLFIEVNKSASPLIYPLISPHKIQKIKIKLRVIGKLLLKKSLQGSKGNDDFTFRIGLVKEGDETLSGFKKIFAPKWIKKLFSLAKGKGIKNIHFYNIFSDERIKNKVRIHPLTKLMKEEFIIPISKDGVVDFTIPVNSRERILALWISSDGDDTKSKFTVVIEKIIIFF